MAGIWIKLDADWHDDPKILDYQERHGKAALVDVIDLLCLIGEFYGSIDLRDRGARIRVERKLRKRGAALDAFIDGVAECGIVSEVPWRSSQRVGSERSIRDGEARKRRRDSAAVAAEASAEARRKAGGT